MNNIDKQYLDLAQEILDKGVTKSDRTGTGTKSLFGRQIRHKMSEGFPLLTTKKMAWRGIATELLWFLRGETTLDYLLEKNCHIWDGDAYKGYKKRGEDQLNRWLNYNPNIQAEFKPIPKEEFIEKLKNDPEFAKQFGDLGPIYGKQWRNWRSNNWSPNGEITIDQVLCLLNDLRTNPDSRRMIVSAWNVDELNQMTLPPCHYSYQVYTRELSTEERNEWFDKNKDQGDADMSIPKRAISLMWNQRSVDLPLGLPFNIASYALLLEILAKEVDMVPDELIGNLGDCHIYLNQEEGIREQITREPMVLPKLKIEHAEPSIIEKPMYWKSEDFQLDGYKSHPTIKFPLSN